jgi:ligand-binding sensor domain-containing protein/signal transduction histidine kinase
MCLVGTAFSLDPSRRVTQYVHEHWGEEEGFVGGTINAIAQSADGYLWIGTERGLVRFDGSRFTLMERPVADEPSVGPVQGLISDTDGNLWVFLEGDRGLLYHDGTFEDIYSHFDLQDMVITASALDYQFRILLSGLGAKTLRYDHKRFETLVETSENLGTVLSLAATRDQSVWLGTREMGLFHSQNGHIARVVPELRNSKINCLASSKDGGLWIGTDDGVYLLDVSSKELFAPSAFRGLQILAMKTDHDDNLWVGTNHGLVRINSFGAVSLDMFDRNSIHQVRTIFEDPDGDIWFGGPQGIDLLRNGMLTSYSAADGLPAVGGGPVYIDAKERVWFAPPSGGLFLMKDGHANPVALAGLGHDVVYSISGGGNEVLVGRQRGGLTILTETGDSFSSRTYETSDGLAQNSVYSVQRGRDGTIWAGTVSSGVSRLSGGEFTNYSNADGLPSNSVNSIIEGFDGTIWVATPDGLASYSNAHWKNYSTQDGLPSASVKVLFEDSFHNLWIGTSEGLSYLSSGKIRVPSKLPEILKEQIFGIAEDSMGFLWFKTSDHIVRVNLERLLAGSFLETDIQSFGTEDGLKGAQSARQDNRLVADQTGRIWLSLSSGLSMADPNVTLKNTMPVSVRIESISAGGKQFDARSGLRIPPGIQNITFNYGHSSLSVPERIRFRYELDGSGQGWSDIFASNQVVISNLGPGSYTFRITASNSLGLWNGPETSVPFVIEPSSWQTWWFQIGCVLACCLIIIAFYRLRMSQMTRQLNVRFQDRLAERTRIAQDLHDTLLQGVLSASMQLDLAEDHIPADSPAKPVLRRVLQLMSYVTEEGRQALKGLRAANSDSVSLESAFSRLSTELFTDSPITYRVALQGNPRPLQPVVRDEVYRIGREAVTNAFIHAQPDTVLVEIEYGNSFFRLVVRDDGRGIDTRVLNEGREGHWGLSGMRERSENIGAQLKLRSRIGSGTEVELMMPGKIAFRNANQQSQSRWFPRFRADRSANAGSEERNSDLP